MQSFSLPLSRRLDFGVNENGHALKKAWDERTSLHLTSEEFIALFELLRDNSEKFAQEIAELKEQQSE